MPATKRGFRTLWDGKRPTFTSDRGEQQNYCEIWIGGVRRGFVAPLMTWRPKPLTTGNDGVATSALAATC
jgi:hypothetical protein